MTDARRSWMKARCRTEGDPTTRTVSKLNDRKVKAVTKPGLHSDGARLYLAVSTVRPEADPGEKPPKRWLFV